MPVSQQAKMTVERKKNRRLRLESSAKGKMGQMETKQEAGKVRKGGKWGWFEQEDVWGKQNVSCLLSKDETDQMGRG